MQNLTEENKSKLINEYLTTRVTVFQLCNKYGIKLNDFYILKGQENFHRKPEKGRKLNSYYTNKQQKYRNLETYKKERICNENFFENFNTEKSAYWAGFILGDGHVSEATLTIHLSTIDLSHLEKFKSDIETNYAITISNPPPNKIKNKEFGTCILPIIKEKLCKDLIKHGITINKSKHCTIPKSLPENMIHHFMRGLFDADGSFWISNNNAHFSVVSSVESFLEEYQAILMKTCDLNKTKIRANGRKTCYEFAYGGNLQVKRIMDYLYKDATIYLERKFNKFQEFYKSHDTINF